MIRSTGLFAVLILLLFGCSGKEGSSESEHNNTASFVVTVDAEEAMKRTIEVSVDAVGTLEAAEDVQLSAEIAGRVREILFEEGSKVEKGTPLLKLDDEIERLQMEQAATRLERMKATLLRIEANLKILEATLKSEEAEVRRTEALEENARRTFERKKKLLEQEASTEAVFLDAKTAFESARAATDKARAARDEALASMDEAAAAIEETRRSIVEAEAGLKIAKERLEKALIHAPFDGILGERIVGPGDYVDTGDGLVQFVAVNPLKMNFTLPERYRGRLSLGQDVALSVEAWPDRAFRGGVIYIAPGLDPTTRSIKVKAAVDNEEGLLHPGFFCKVRLILDTREEAVVIPEECVIPRGEQFFVYSVEGGKAVMKEVKLGQRLPGSVEILEGLAAGEIVITAGHQRVSSGYPVRVRERNGGSATGEDL